MKKKPRKIFCIRLSETERKEVKKMETRHGKSFSELVRKALKSLIKK